MKNLVAYDATGKEPNLEQLLGEFLHRGIAIALPRYSRRQGCYELAYVSDLKSELTVGHYGIREPRSALPALPETIRDAPSTAWLVPGIAFDSTGTRLGRGAGYYDRMLSTSEGLRIGVAYHWCVCAWLPREEHDVKMDWLATDAAITRCADTTAKHWEERM